MSTLYVDNLEPNLGSQVEIPDLKPLAGSVVQMVVGADTSTSNSAYSTSWTEVTSNLRTDITLKTANPIIHVTWIANPESDGSSTGSRLFTRIYYAINGTSFTNHAGTHMMALGTTNPQEGNQNIICVFEPSANAGDTITVTPYVYSQDGNDTVEFGQEFQSSMECRILIQEIAQ